MSKKKGLSIEEKVVKVEEWFIENPHPFTMKDIMAAVPRAKGVIFQSIEECMELLISEGRVSSEKIGINVFYWRFAQTDAQRAASANVKRNSGGAQQQQGKGARGESGRSTADSLAPLSVETLATMENSLVALLASREADLAKRREVVGDPDQRATLQSRLKAVRAEVVACEKKLTDVADQDPAVVESLLRQSQIAIDAANRWTDNIFIMEQQMTKPGSGVMSSRQFRQQFQIPQQLDFIEMG